MSGSILDDIKWLKAHPHFEFRPASIDEFLGPEYLDISAKVRPGVKGVLYKIFGKDAQEDRISIVERAIMTGGIGIGKNFRPDELVMTPSGERQIGTLRSGDLVIGKDGKSHKVTGVYPNKDIQYYRMTFCDGTQIDCGEEHLWEVDEDTSYGHKVRVLTTKQILEKGLRWNADRKWRFSMPNVEPVEFVPEEIIVPPYSWAVIFLYGVVLGDRLHILVDNEKIRARMKEELEFWCYPSSFHGEFCFKRRDNGFGNRLWSELEQLEDDETKRTVDARYLWGESKVRLEFLRGLMDSKVAKGQRKNLNNYFQTNRSGLLEDIVHLTRSLGGYSRIVTRKERIKGWTNIYHSAHVILPQGPFYAFPELNTDPKKGWGAQRMDSRRIVDIQKLDKGDGVCIAVDAEDHLYVTRDFIVTHNTTFASIALPYMAHWVLCLKDPQGYYNLLPGSRIAFMQMSTSEQQAREVIFGDIDARIKNSPWFNKHYPRDPKYTKQIRFPKDIWIIPGDSAETTFEGYNILGGILDEADCVDLDTQILTDAGWKTMHQLNEGDNVLTLNHKTGMSEWQPCLEVKTFAAQEREVIRMEGKEFSSLTTLNHKWAIERPYKNQKLFVTSDSLGSYDRIPRIANCSSLPTIPKFSDALVELVAWFYTEGHDRNGEGKTLWIHQSPRANSENCERIRAALRELFGPSVSAFPRQGRGYDGLPRWRENLRINKDDYWGSQIQFILSASAGGMIQEHAPGKVPSFEFLLSLTKDQLELFIKTSLLADNNGSRRFAQKDKKAAEAFAFACILAGYPVSIRPRKPTASCGYIMWNVYMSKKRFHTPRDAARKAEATQSEDGMLITRGTYGGIVWCPRTENHTWLARRNGTVYFTGNSHKVVKDKDYAQIGMETIENRIKSRYVDHSDPTREGHKGLLIVIGQMKSQFGFASRIYNQYVEDPRAVAVRMTIWESFGWEQYVVDGKRNSFWYDVKRKRMIDPSIANKIGVQDGHLIEVPKQYLYEFTTNPEKALKDLGGIPPGASDPFISQVAKIDDANERWMMHHPGKTNPVAHTSISPKIDPTHILESPSIRRTAHIDFAYAANGDSAGIALGHVKELVENEHGDLTPYIVFDMLIRVRATPGEQVLLSDIRSYIYQLIKEFHYKIHRVTLDGFQSVDTMQQFRKRKISADYLSVDRSKEPYEALRDALNEDRIEFPPYMTYLTYASELKADEQIDIIRRELTALQDTGQKIDHPPGGSKDVADAMAGVVSSLMSDSTYRKGVPSQRRTDYEPRKIESLDELFKGFETATSAVDPLMGSIGNLKVPNLAGMTTSDRLPKRFRPKGVE